jgi:hypothetical protein
MNFEIRGGLVERRVPGCAFEHTLHSTDLAREGAGVIFRWPLPHIIFLERTS